MHDLIHVVCNCPSCQCDSGKSLQYINPTVSRNHKNMYVGSITVKFYRSCNCVGVVTTLWLSTLCSLWFNSNHIVHSQTETKKEASDVRLNGINLSSLYCLVSIAL